MEPLGYGVLPTITESSWMTLFVLCCACFFSAVMRSPKSVRLLAS